MRKFRKNHVSRALRMRLCCGAHAYKQTQCTNSVCVCVSLRRWFLISAGVPGPLKNNGRRSIKPAAATTSTRVYYTSSRRRLGRPAAAGRRNRAAAAAAAAVKSPGHRRQAPRRPAGQTTHGL